MPSAINYAPLQSLHFAPLEFVIEAKEELHLPRYKGSALRGGFGHAFLRAVCMTHTHDCPPCLLKSSCVYYNIFESKIDKPTADRLRIGVDAPHPYIIEPPLTEQRRFEAGERISYSVILVGEAIRFLPHFVHTFRTQGERFGLGKGKGKFDLLRVTDASGASLFDASHPDRFDPAEPITASNILPQTHDAHRLTLRFITPTRIRAKDSRGERSLLKLARSEHFWILAAHLYHNLFTLAQLYCGEVAAEYPRHPFDFTRDRVRLTHANIAWEDWERFSNRQFSRMKAAGFAEDEATQMARMKLGGFVGEATFEGDVAEFVPLFRLGQALHIGNGTTFGLGKFVVV